MAEDKKLEVEDASPQSSTYPYAWSPDRESELSLAQFLTKYKPSMVQDDGTKPWIWARGSKSNSRTDEQAKKEESAVGEATELLKEVTEKVEKIKNDSSIPVRSNKKTGAKSKKEVREAEQATASEKLKEISIKHGFIGGKWLIFAPSDRVDVVWSTVATSLVSGPLADTSAYLAKVATCPQNEMPHYQHVICIYIPDVYDKEAITEILRVLLRQHGITPSGVKSNLYTSIGVDSKHASGIQSTVGLRLRESPHNPHTSYPNSRAPQTWKNTAVLPDAEIKALKDEYFSTLNAAKEGKKEPSPEKANKDENEAKDVESSAKPAKAKPKPKLKPKKKAGADDPFASDDDDAGSDDKLKPPPERNASKRSAAAADDDSDDEAESKPQKKRARA
ncbi:hypothetical protein EVG20_g2577 [Dentipellis fragilis]|uniref:Uncharacterized protein n=1 Tax=Dentipellis fragilis TaxID=205917 RepID=A0A4Y9Z6P6_9AGAM|nr:hypothetical protein EVG20_g2577 [Dentipellis fragilis]